MLLGCSVRLCLQILIEICIDWRSTLSRLAVSEYVIRSTRVPPELDGLRVAQISDLHLRSWNGVLAAARLKLADIDPEMIVITGDLGDTRAPAQSVADLVHRLLDGLTPSLGVFAVLGNHDDRQLTELVEPDVRVLNNEHVRVEYCGQSLVVAGIDDRTPTSSDVPSAILGAASEQFTVLLAPFPSAIYRLPPKHVDLMLAGHTHAGQIRLPGVGALWPVFEGIPRKFCKGLHEWNGTRFYVNAGLGCSWILPFRVCCPPEIAVFTLKSHDDSGVPVCPGTVASPFQRMWTK